MVEIFKYTERVVNMVRPRKLLFMAIGKHLEMCVYRLLKAVKMVSLLAQK